MGRRRGSGRAAPERSQHVAWRYVLHFKLARLRVPVCVCVRVPVGVPVSVCVCSFAQIFASGIFARSIIIQTQMRCL